MSYFFDASIGEIRVFLRKSEEERFRFSKTQREGDGFVYFSSGKGKFNIDGSSYEVTADTFIKLKKGDSYSFDVMPPYSYIVSDMDIFISGKDNLPRVLRCTEEEKNLLGKAYKIWTEQEEYCYTQTRILLLELLVAMSKRVEKQYSGKSWLVAAVLSYIHRYYTENFTIEDLAKACNASASYIRQRFKQELGVSVMQYREELRIARAKTMISSGEFKLKEIADLLGYYDIYHFSKRFKEVVGVSPGVYKQ